MLGIREPCQNQNDSDTTYRTRSELPGIKAGKPLDFRCS
jgi:hypothetical protein